MERPKDYYRILGVPRDASLTTIRKAFRRLSRRPRPETPELRELQAAFDVLSDADRRRRYDESLSHAETPRARAWTVLRAPTLSRLRRPVRQGSLSGEILLTPVEASAGGVLPLDVPLRSSCASCDGTGGSVFNCPSCGGEGVTERRMPISVRIPAGVRGGAVFQVDVDDPGVLSVFLTVHIRAR
jgi:DnaJ-class molecular chaperone